ncbi:family 43 glycosylhydrolase [Tamlana agarivorans]|uniref:Family 43 glycosylhydrolase n=1 Tax=Pseudotamlana agarivorans TaxID=481183 RepID=A0ACC5U976_9FLAO|nr:family 43 glycosylhydrolase [Tamlana agarivorans]MBU2950874.1 family 43 glycosylhydrolase [Tamlana agarivorans]
MKTNFIIFFLIIGQLGLAQNPVLKEGDSNFLYVCDPAAEVFNGKVYVYCSHDQPDAINYESMKDYVVLESSDLKTWINHSVSLDPQLDKGFEYAQSNMNAPDAAYKDGWYYWYFPSDITHVGVAKSKTPVGPWKSAIKNEIATIFDPTVFVDDDGQAYIYGNDHWVDIGDEGSHIMGAKLKDNMVELDGPWVRLSQETVNEAVHVFKRNGIYYFSARVGPVTKYWMADSPLPQYADLKGELAPNSPESPNHTSVIAFNNEWYLFYHRGDVNHGNRYKRSVCFDKMTFRADGTVEPITYTLDADVEITAPVYPPRVKKEKVETNIGASEQPDGYLRYEGESYSEKSKGSMKASAENQKKFAPLKNGDWLQFSDLTFGKSPKPFTFRIRLSAKNAGGSIVLRINSESGTVIGSIPVTSTGGLEQYKTLSTELNRIRTSQTIYITYEGPDDNLVYLDWFEWNPETK